jgi:hypothetical protein
LINQRDDGETVCFRCPVILKQPFLAACCITQSSDPDSNGIVAVDAAFGVSYVRRLVKRQVTRQRKSFS